VSIAEGKANWRPFVDTNIARRLVIERETKIEGERKDQLVGLIVIPCTVVARPKGNSFGVVGCPG
jgi:hypothetical protein